jgi:hypothetical protein
MVRGPFVSSLQGNVLTAAEGKVGLRCSTILPNELCLKLSQTTVEISSAPLRSALTHLGQ